MRVHGPERLGGQGLDSNQYESGNRAILHLLDDPVVGDQVDLVITWRGDTTEAGAYEVWSRRGLVRFRRLVTDDGSLDFEVVEVVAQNPIENQDPLALATLEEEKQAALASGFAADDAAGRFIDPEHQSYPFAYERIAQLFDSPNAPDLVISSKDYCWGTQPGQHGALHVRQSRAPLWLSGPGIVPGHHDVAVRAVDIAPTCLAALGFPAIDGVDATGSHAPTYLARQDGRVVDEVLAPDSGTPTHLYMILLDGMHQTELEDRLARDPDALPNLRRLRERAAVLTGGSIVNFPSITWPSHTAIATGAWCGHHDVVNPSYYLRETRETVSPQGQALRTEGFANAAVESLYEAFHRQHPGCITAAINAPFGRSATHADLEGRNLCDKPRLKELTAQVRVDQNDRWPEAPAVAGESVIDTRGMAQVIALFERPDVEPPRFVYHELALTDGAGHDYGPHSEGLADALDESDTRIGRVLALLDQRGLFDQTLFVVTADHGMAPQDTSLRANPSVHVRDVVEAVVAEPMIWLLDAHVVAERKPDRRTGRVLVCDDCDESGERPPIAGVEVTIEAVIDGESSIVAAGTTNDAGVFGFATPSDVDDRHLVATVRVPGKNPRRVRFDGDTTAVDPRAALYG